MISEKELQQMLNKYNFYISREKKKQILKKSTPNEVEKILNYLINELNIDPRNIEKCPSLLYKNFNDIKTNYEFLKDKELYNYSIETCLHILEVSKEELIKTYNYIIKYYGSELLNKNTSILKVPVEKIENVEKYLNGLIPNQALLGACLS